MAPSDRYDRETWSEKEKQFLNKFCPLMLLFPLWLLIALLVRCMVDYRKRTRPLCRLWHQLGRPSRGQANGSSILWHFCTLGMETLFVQASKDEKQEPGVSITSGESYAVTAGTDSVLTVWDNQPNLLAEKSKLREKIVELDTRKFVNRHVYVIWDSRKSSEDFTDGFIGAWAGTSTLSDSSEWDALQTGASDMDLEAGNAPSKNMPFV